jgi:hypothetical protein
VPDAAGVPLPFVRECSPFDVGAWHRSLSDNTLILIDLITSFDSFSTTKTATMRHGKSGPADAPE